MATFLAFFPDDILARQAVQCIEQPTIVSYITQDSNQHFDSTEGYYPNLTPYIQVPLENTSDDSPSTIAHSLFAITGSDSLYQARSIKQRLTDYGLKDNALREGLNLINHGQTALHIETPADKKKGHHILKEHGATKVYNLDH